MALDIGGKWALVTGASAGIGREIARDLAARGCNIVLVARKKDALESAAAELRTTYGIKTQVQVADLTDISQCDMLHKEVVDAGIDVSILINNAGFGVYGKFDSIEVERELGMITINASAPVRLTHLFVGSMKKAGFGRILIAGSTASFLPMPLYAAHGAAKVFALFFATAIRRELRGTGVTVTAFCPGVVFTDFHVIAGHADNAFKNATGKEAPVVARAAVRALLSGRALSVPGLFAKACSFLPRLFPRTAAAAISESLMKR